MAHCYNNYCDCGVHLVSVIPCLFLFFSRKRYFPSCMNTYCSNDTDTPYNRKPETTSKTVFASPPTLILVVSTESHAMEEAIDFINRVNCFCPPRLRTEKYGFGMGVCLFRDPLWPNRDWIYICPYKYHIAQTPSTAWKCGTQGCEHC